MTNIPVIDLARTGANIVNLRKAAGLSVHDLQVVFGFNSPQAIYKWQNGTALPTVDNLIVLATLLHVRIDDILVTTVALAGGSDASAACGIENELSEWQRSARCKSALPDAASAGHRNRKPSPIWSARLNGQDTALSRL